MSAWAPAYAPAIPAFWLHHPVHSRLSKFFCRPGRAFCQEIAKTFTLADHFNQLDQHGRIAKAQLKSAGIFSLNNALFKTIHRPGNGCPARDRVDAVFIAELIGFTYRSQVAHTRVGTKSRQGLVFGSAVKRIYRVGSIVDFNYSLAANNTGITGIAVL